MQRQRTFRLGRRLVVALAGLTFGACPVVGPAFGHGGDTGLEESAAVQALRQYGFFLSNHAGRVGPARRLADDRLVGVLKRAKRGGCEVRVAVLGRAIELGEDSGAFRRPQQSAEAVGRLLAPSFRGVVLIVGTAGTGVSSGGGRPDRKRRAVALAAIGRAGRTSQGLVGVGLAVEAISTRALGTSACDQSST